MSDRGFTLLELIIVTVLAVLVLGLVGLLFANTVPSARLTATAGEIVATMRQLKALAEMSGEDERFVVDLDTKRYGVEGRRARAIPAEISVKAVDPLYGEVKSGKYYMVASGMGMEGGALILSYRKKSLRIQADPILGAQVERQ